jgi:hypothetical protein
MASSAFRAFVATYLWAWFIVPTFGLPPLGLVTAMGISVLISLLFGSQPEGEDDDAAAAFERSMKRVMVSFIYTVVAFVFGFLYQLFL